MVVGGTGSDNVLGGRGNDLVNGFRGSDNIVGQEGNDFLIVGPLRETPKDIIFGEDGTDWVIAKNVPAAKDIVACGRDFDRVLADRKDVVAPGCERVYFGLTAEEFIHKAIPRSFFEGLPPPPEG